MQYYSKMSFPFDLTILSATFDLVKSKILIYGLSSEVEFHLPDFFIITIIL
jgi:hypothetical protein